MRKIDVTDYKLDGENAYPMREALAEVLFHPGLRIVALDLLKRDDLARKILATNPPDLLLEEAEYAMIKSAVDTVNSYTRNDVEFVRRVVGATPVEVVENHADH